MNTQFSLLPLPHFFVSFSFIIALLYSQIYDNYADNNGTKWQLCKFSNLKYFTGNVDDDDDGGGGGGGGGGSVVFSSTEQEPYALNLQSIPPAHILSDSVVTASGQQREKRQQRKRRQFVAPPVYITSYLNTLHIRQRTAIFMADANLNATVRIQLGECTDLLFVQVMN